MPQQVYRVTTPQELTIRSLQQLVVELNTHLLHVSQQLGALQGRDGAPQLQTHLDANQKRLTNLAPSQADGDAVTRGELVQYGLFVRRPGDRHTATTAIKSTQGIEVYQTLQPRYGVNIPTVAGL